MKIDEKFDRDRFLAIGYNTPIRPCDETFFGLPNFSTTHLPQTTALVRAVAIEAFAALLCLTTSIWCWPVLLISTAFAGWTIYANMLRPDPLVETLYKIVGGKQNFDALPTLDLPHSKKTLLTNIEEIQWNKLEYPIYRAKTTDGRQMMIVKALSEEIDPVAKCPTKSIFAFVEKLGPDDTGDQAADLSPENSRRLLHLFSALSFKGNTFGRTISSSAQHGTVRPFNSCEESGSSHKFVAFSSITNELAKEIKEHLYFGN